MKKRLKIFSPGVIMLLLVLIMLIAPVKSFAKIGGIIVYPNYIELDFSKDSRTFVSKVINVENPSDQPMRIRASMQDWDISPDGTLQFLKENIPETVQGAVKFNPQEFDLAPGQKQQVRLTAKLPEGTEGEYRSMIFFESVNPREEIVKPDNSKLSVQINFTTRFGVVLYAYKGKVNRTGTLEKFGYETKDGSGILVASVRNDGNIHTVIEGNFTLLSLDGKELFTSVAQKFSVLPQRIQMLKFKIPDGIIPDGNYTAKLRLTFKDMEEKEKVLAAQTDFQYQQPKLLQAKKNLKKPNGDENVERTPENTAKPMKIDSTEIKLQPKKK